MESIFLKDQTQIENICSQIRQRETFITLDTEFYRRSTYYAELCLVQIGTAEDVFFLDPKEIPTSQWGPFFELLADASIQKVLHAPYEDLEIFFHLMGKSVRNIFDTQIAAAFLDFGLSISYQNIIQSLLGKELDKSVQKVDWRTRPFTPQQLIYGADDVIYLRQLYEICLKKLQENARMSWVIEEMAFWENTELFTSFVSETYQKLSSGVPFERAPLLYALLCWREETAKSLNISRGRVLEEETLLFLVRFKKGEAFFDALRKKIPSQIEVQSIQEYIYNVEPESIPAPLPKRERLSYGKRGLYEFLKLLLQETSAQTKIPSSLIAPKEELSRFVQGEENKELSILKGWRKEVFGNKALALQEGKISATYKDQKIWFVENLD